MVVQCDLIHPIEAEQYHDGMTTVLGYPIEATDHGQTYLAAPTGHRIPILPGEWMVHLFGRPHLMTATYFAAVLRPRAEGASPAGNFDQILERSKQMKPSRTVQSLQRAGIITADGQLAEHYRDWPVGLIEQTRGIPGDKVLRPRAESVVSDAESE